MSSRPTALDARVVGAPRLAEIRVPEHVQPMIERHDDGVVRAGEAGTVDNAAGAGASREPAAVQPDEYRTLAAVLQAWREHIQHQAVFAL